MKQTVLSLSLLLMVALSVQAQPSGDFMYQPKDITARRINSNGEITKEYQAAFHYNSNGQLVSFVFPEWNVTSGFAYEDNKLTRSTTSHTSGNTSYHNEYLFEYEGDLLKTEKHVWDMNLSEHYEYYYNEAGRLVRKENLQYDNGDLIGWWTYEYDDIQKTKTTSMYGHYDNNGAWAWGLLRTIVHQYDESYSVLSEQTDNIDPQTQEVTSSVRTLYSYTPQGNLQSLTKQTFTDGEWVDNTLEFYTYDDNVRLSEQQYSHWSEELNGWAIDRKIVHEYDADTLHTITFFKKNGEDWVYDAFSFQTILFEPELKWQQFDLEQMIYQTYQEPSMINQLELTVVATPKPIYLSVDKEEGGTLIYPNPGKEEVVVTTPLENAVIRFYDLQGRLLVAQPFSFKTTVNTSGWSKGVYAYEVWDSFRKEASGKWMKQ